MDKVSATHHLTRRKGDYCYRRRVPDHHVAAIGKSVLQFSLQTKDLKQTKQRREVKDIEWSARPSAAEDARHRLAVVEQYSSHSL
jgi:hypothetical protein